MPRRRGSGCPSAIGLVSISRRDAPALFLGFEVREWCVQATGRLVWLRSGGEPAEPCVKVSLEIGGVVQTDMQP